MVKYLFNLEENSTIKKLLFHKNFKRIAVLILLILAVSDLIDGFIKGWNLVH